MSAVEKSAGFGSIWNNNSWFFEEKNYNVFAKEFLTREICKVEVTKGDTIVKLYDIKEMKGQASVTIRKQKQIFLFEYEIEVYFTAHKLSDPETECKGKVLMHEFNQDDDEIQFDITLEKQTDFNSEVKKILNNEINEMTLAKVQSLFKAMKDKDADSVKLKQDQMKREEAKKATMAAQAQTGDQKAQIFADAKKNEAEFKKAEEVKAQNNLVPLKPIDQSKVVAGTGSVWNNNSYHWEQKSVDKWSEATLKQILSLFYFKQENATLRVTEVKTFTGESSVSIRKQKKIVTYEYAATLKWKCDMGDAGNTKVIGSFEGEFEMPEISNDVIDDGEEWEINSRIMQGGDDELKKTLYQMVKKFAPDALRKQIMTKFVEELKKK